VKQVEAKNATSLARFALCASPPLLMERLARRNEPRVAPRSSGRRGWWWGGGGGLWACSRRQPAPAKAASRYCTESHSSLHGIFLRSNTLAKLTKNGRSKGVLFRATARQSREIRLIAPRSLAAASLRDAQWWARWPARRGRERCGDGTSALDGYVD
jgi:hypothetical protein